MKTVKLTLFAVMAVALMTITCATGASAALSEAQGLFSSNEVPGLTVEIVNSGSLTDLDPMNIVAYAPASASGTRSMWSIPWISDITGPSAYSGYNSDDFTVHVLNSDKTFASSAIFTALSWSTPANALISAATLGLNWFTVGVVSFDPTYNSFTFSGFDWRGNGTEVIEIAGSFTRVTPIPGAVWLLGSGLVGLVGLRRKTKN